MARREIKSDFEGEQYKFEVIGQVLEGYFHGTSTVNINGKPTKKHLFKLKDGSTVGPLGSKDLNDRLAKAEVVLGAYTWVTFVAKKKLQGQPMALKIFKVEQDSDDMDTGVSAAPAASTPSSHTPSSVKQQRVLS